MAPFDTPVAAAESVVEQMMAAAGDARIVIDAGHHGGHLELSHGEVLARGADVARHFAELGVVPGDRVIALLPTGPALLFAVFGSWYSGATVGLLPENIGDKRSDISQARVRSILTTVEPRLIVISSKSNELFDWASEFPDARLVTDQQLLSLPSRGGDIPYMPVGDDLAFLQFSSGSTGTPRGVKVCHKQMVHNIRDIVRRAGIEASDVSVNWLPLNHDMGFIAGLMIPLFCRMDLNLTPPERFARSPFLWLQNLSAHRGTLSPSPPFSYRVLARLGGSRQLSDIDLSSWRYAWIGAEPVYPDHLREFNLAFARRGLSSETLRPSYGLAETVVGVSCLGVGDAVIEARFDSRVFRETGAISPVGPGASAALAMIGCGAAPRRGPGEWFDTGDLGFLMDGQIFISGRAKDVVIRAGQNFAATDIEAAIEMADPERIKRSAVFSVIDGSRRGEDVVAFVECRAGNLDRQALDDRICAMVSAQLGLQLDHIRFVAAGRIPRTTSGKLQRNLCRALYLSDAPMD